MPSDDPESSPFKGSGKGDHHDASAVPPIEDLPIEWDFRWVESDQEASTVYIIELAREVLRQTWGRLTNDAEREAFFRFIEGVVFPGMSLESFKATEGLNQADFVVGVLMQFAAQRGTGLGRLQPALARLDLIRSQAANVGSEPMIRVSPVPDGRTFLARSWSGESYFVVRIPRGATAGMAKSGFGTWADANLPADKIKVGGRGRPAMDDLIRLAYHRFHSRWEHPRPHAGFAVAVRQHADGPMKVPFSLFGSNAYAPFMDPSKDQPKASTWSEDVSIVKSKIEPMILELASAVRTLV